MKSLIKRPAIKNGAAKGSKTAAEREVAQCCAKVSKAIAGCHD